MKTSAMSTYHCAWPSSILSVPPSSPCGPINETNPVVPCCAQGDSCLSNNICAYNTHSDGGGSGYYSAGCSNGGFSDADSRSVCASRCADTGLPDITYDSLDGFWKCCGGNYNERDCQSPTNESFIAPAPSSLVTYWVVGSSTTSSTPPTSITTSTTTAAAPSNSETQISDATHSALSVGAEVAIGVCAGVGSLVLLAGIFILLRRRHRRTKRNQHVAQSVEYQESTPNMPHELYTPADKPQELPPDARISLHELH
ncbi:hypothetical protein BGW36DRAFT_391968 [Talaromyces proteolyticus]|uniref:Uncharacterized protein n=1 Tax=Talaromyces proteolyticus TaxID=1131652 RepID=A0AAD4KDT0_9EURO|nr:uncharacterized protein BGW36DRAFT_391968 [Talaromyces proteolyticus]KAH8689196.1 hypothetical protein BGW36DRAFT_391968 [Talaromyces proteolyticus]